MVPLLLKLEPKTLNNLGKLTISDWFWFITSGFIGSTAQLTLLFIGLNLTTTLDGSIINSTSPILIAIAGSLFLKEIVTRREMIGNLISFLGTLLIVIQPLFNGHTIFSGSITGNIFVLLGTAAWVVYVIMTKKQLNHKLSPFLLTTNMFVTGLICESLLLLFTSTPLEISTRIFSAPLSSHLSVLFMALFSGTLAYYLYQKAQKLIEVSEANIILYSSPLFTIPLSYFWLKEAITVPIIIGGLIIALGIIISETRSTRRHHLV
jgi:drug/metabolite transporter (DMT)-like permease